MVAIGNTDHVVALVRAQLTRLARAKRGDAASRSGKTGAATAAKAGSRLDALATMRSLGDEEFERVLVRALLTDEFGEGVSEDPRFQAIVERTATVLRSDPALAGTMAEVRSRLSADR